MEEEIGYVQKFWYMKQLCPKAVIERLYTEATMKDPSHPGHHWYVLRLPGIKVKLRGPLKNVRVFGETHLEIVNKAWKILLDSQIYRPQPGQPDIGIKAMFDPMAWDSAKKQFIVTGHQ